MVLVIDLLFISNDQVVLFSEKTAPDLIVLLQKCFIVVFVKELLKLLKAAEILNAPYILRIQELYQCLVFKLIICYGMTIIGHVLGWRISVRCVRMRKPVLIWLVVCRDNLDSLDGWFVICLS